MNTYYTLPKHLLKQAIKEAAGCNGLKEACRILSERTGIPDYIIYTTSNGSFSPKHHLFLMAYLAQYVDLNALMRTDEILNDINRMNQ